ncbi:10288_t:CDS:2 [Cetraspora pellucida]|uniref:10288_t:CDS:1 n=1 Tax=Cetraspora pellucida TaxID=1433469 RepID=A0A9N9CAE7_9GLOM|nr:10288_t:CDS:2 [Cetraspora pellucida]
MKIIQSIAFELDEFEKTKLILRRNLKASLNESQKKTRKHQLTTNDYIKEENRNEHTNKETNIN